MSVNTKRAERRSLTFSRLSDVAAEVERLLAADRAGTLRHTGNWTPGQTFAHLAAFMEYPYDGYPASLAHPPWIVRFIMKGRKNKLLRGPMPAGVRIPGIKGGTEGADPAPTPDAGARLLRAIGRIDKAPPSIDNPIFGPLTHDEWRALHCRHAELHLGFLFPSGGAAVSAARTP